MKKKSSENLIPISKRTTDEAREISIKGGKKSGETRRKQRELKTMMNAIDRTSLPADISETYEGVLQMDNPSYRDAVIATIYLKALAGDIRAIELYLKLKGEMPKDIELKAGDKSMTIIWNEKRYDDDINEKTE